MNCSNRARTAAFTLAWMLLGANALAQSPAEAEARQLFREGVALHKAKDYSAALSKFRKAYRSWKNPKILANIGTAAWELGQYALAANSYDRFLAEAPADAPERPEVEKALSEVLPLVGTLEVNWRGLPKSVTIDDQVMDPKRLRRVRLTPGRHKVEAVTEDGSRVERSVKLLAGSTVIFSLDLQTRKSQKPVFLVEQTVPPGPEPSRPTSPLVWVFGGVGVAGLATSAVLYSMKNSLKSELQAECINTVCPDSSADKIDRANTLGMFSAITFGVGVAGLGVATYLFLNPPKGKAESKHEAFELRVRTGPGAASVTVGRRF